VVLLVALLFGEGNVEAAGFGLKGFVQARLWWLGNPQLKQS
jgi:hypothetical protein